MQMLRNTNETPNSPATLICSRAFPQYTRKMYKEGNQIKRNSIRSRAKREKWPVRQYPATR